MDKFIIKGGRKLMGEVEISGAKNAAVAILPAVILADEPCVIENVPNISDVSISLRILYEMGAQVDMLNETTYRIDPRGILNCCVPYESARQMRASYYFLGALLGKYHRARVSMPGGCPLGDRPIDQHLKAFTALGAKCTIDHGMVDVTADRLRGSQIYLDVVSVGATMNIMMAAALAEGTTTIENAAKEPHIVDLANFLNSMGADIRGAGTDTIKIRGVEHMHGCNYSIIPDQIEAGTYMVAAAATDGNVLIKNVIPKHLESISAKLIECGIDVIENDDSIRVCANGRPGKCTIKAMPYPGFPTDMQPQMTALLSIADGTSFVSEGVWDNRFRYVEQLTRMGASIKVEGKMAVIEGVEQLKGAPVRADDLRAGAAMIIAGLIAKGTTEIEEISHIDRGYENIVEKLTGLGADIRRVDRPEPDDISRAV